MLACAELAGGAREALETVALVAAGRNVLAGCVVLAGLVRGTIVEILVAQNAAPVLVAQTLAGREAVAIAAARIRLALVAARACPARATLTGARRIALARLAVRPTFGLQTVALFVVLPALEAHLLAGWRAPVVAELVVARATERVAAVAKVVERAVDSVQVGIREKNSS